MATPREYHIDIGIIPEVKTVERSDVSSEKPRRWSTRAKALLGLLALLAGAGVVTTAVAVPLIVLRTTAPTDSTTTDTTTTATTATTTTATTTTTSTTTSTQTTITFAPVGIYALNISICATWNNTGGAQAGNQNGTLGVDLGSLSAPVSIFIDNDDVLYVADRDNHRVIKYYQNSSIGIVVAGNGTAGDSPTQLRGLKGVAVDQSGAIIVADSDNYRIQKFPVNSTVGITLASNSTVNPLGQMRDLHIDVNNNIFVTDSDYNQVGKYIPFSSLGIVVAGGGPSGRGLNQLSNPYGNFIDPNGTLYVADQGNHRIMKYEPGSLNGTVVAGNGTAGSSIFQLSGPLAVIVDNNGYIYVADNGNARIMRWTTNYAAGGTCIIACTGIRGNGLNQLRSTRDIKFDRHGNIYVSDQGNHRILKFGYEPPPSGCSSSG